VKGVFTKLMDHYEQRVVIRAALEAAAHARAEAVGVDVWLVTNGPDGLCSKVVAGFENLKHEVVAAVFGDGDDDSEEAQDMRDRLETPGDWEGDRWSISWSFEDGYLNVQRVTDLSTLAHPAVPEGMVPFHDSDVVKRATESAIAFWRTCRRPDLDDEAKVRGALVKYQMSLDAAAMIAAAEKEGE